MKNLKFIIGFAIFGFLLSFFSGLFSGAGFGIVLLKALLFALIFGALSFGISIVFQKFLASDVSESVISENKTDSHPAKKSEHAVDIVLENEDLPPEENIQPFLVGGQHQMLNQKDVADANQASAATSNANLSKTEEELDSIEGSIMDANKQANNGGFVPMPLAETASNISGTEAKTVSEVNSMQKNNMDASDSNTVSQTANDSEDLDTLPDLEDLPQQQVVPATVEDEMVEDSDFSKNGVPSKDADEIAKGKDAALMAKAISTLLAKE